MSKKRMPGKRWRGGVEGWEADMNRAIDKLKAALSDPPTSSDRKADLIMNDTSYASTRFLLGLYEA